MAILAEAEPPEPEADSLLSKVQYNLRGLVGIVGTRSPISSEEATDAPCATQST
jgi:hypothetical protein